MISLTAVRITILYCFYSENKKRNHFSRCQLISKLKTYADQLNFTSKFIRLCQNQVEKYHVICEKSIRNDGAVPYNHQKYLENQTNAATREDLNVEYIPSTALYLSNVRRVQHKEMTILANLLRRIGPMIMKLKSLVSGAEKFDLDYVRFFNDSWGTRMINLLIGYYFSFECATCLKNDSQSTFVFYLEFFMSKSE